MNETISVVGLGKLGLCLAAVIADAGFQTIGVDIEEGVVRQVNAGKPPFFEPGLQELLSRHSGRRLVATTDHARAINESDVTFVLVATPSNADGSFSNRYVESALKSLGKAFRLSGKAYHDFVISSTVTPGSTASSFIPLIEQYSGKRLNSDFGVCYDPDFVALGDVIRGFKNPEMVVLGESSEKVGNRLLEIHRQICGGEVRVARMSLISAEIAKVSLNTYVTVKISFANMLANLCERVPGADVDAISAAIGTDRRISPYYFRGGLAFGGTCFPRDTRAFKTFSQSLGYEPALIEAIEKINQYQSRHLLDLVLENLPRDNGGVGVLGLAFKAKTSVITESPTMKLIEELIGRDLRVVVYDPLALANAKVVFEDRVEYVSSASECLDAVSVCVVGNTDVEYKQAIEEYRGDNRKTVLDCWRIVDRARIADQVNYIAWGYA